MDSRCESSTVSVVQQRQLHIEQGPVLETSRTDLGLVTAIAGITRMLSLSVV